MSTKAFNLTILVVTILVVAAFAQSPLEVPQNVPASRRASLNIERAGLNDWHSNLLAKAIAHNRKCTGVTADTPLDDQCRREQADLEAEKAKYYAAVRKFNADVKAANRIAAFPTSTPSPLPLHPRKGEMIPRDLAHDPVAARLSQAQLDQVQARMARLQKAIDLLSYTANPKWEEAWNQLVDDMRENAHEQTRVGLDGLTAGIAEAANLSSARDVKLATQAVDLPVWRNLAAEREQLEHLASSSVLTQGSAGDGLRRTIAAMKRLESARNAQNTAEALSTARDAVFNTKEGYDQVKSIAKDPTIANALYRGSAAVGITASAFASAAVKEVTAPIELTVKVGEAGLLLKQAHEEDEQFKTLSQGSYNRHQKQLELEKTMGELQEERSRLQWAVNKAR